MKLKNISSSTYRLQGRYVWLPEAELDVPEEIAQHVLSAQPERFELIPESQTPQEGSEPARGSQSESGPERAVEDAPNRMQTRGRRRG